MLAWLESTMVFQDDTDDDTDDNTNDDTDDDRESIQSAGQWIPADYLFYSIWFFLGGGG